MINKNILLFFLLSCLWLHTLAQDISVAISNSPRDSVVTFASLKYQPHSIFRKILMGSNYRKEWEQYVTVPVFHFTGSGFKILELGGGMQTKSLRLSDSSGKIWSLRTVDKQVSLNLDASLQNSLGREIAQDLISSGFPYAVPLAGELAFAAGINAARPKVFFVADDEAFGEMRSIFSNSLCTLEERDPGFDKSFATEEMYEKLLSGNNYKIEQRVLLRARLFDILIGDWDRHEGNWRWGLKDSAGFNYYHAVPRDRDWSFYHSGGILPHLAQLAHNTQYFISFKAHLKRVKELSYKSWMFDRSLLNELMAADWQSEIRRLQSLLTDSAIQKAVDVLPKEIKKLSGEEFVFKIKGRRDRLEEEVMKYYRFVAEEIIINGSAKNEIFSIVSNDENVVITITDAAANTKIYRRIFTAAETVSITLNGLAGDDVFEIDEKLNSKIRFVINGGNGADEYNIKGKGKIKIYDSKEDNNKLTNKSNAKIYFN
jgi:hypothetical protein